MGNLDQDIQAYSPTDLLGRYAWITDHGGAPDPGTQDATNLFTYQFARTTLGRNPTPAEIVGGPGVLTASNVNAIKAAQDNASLTTAPPGSTVDTSGNVLAPGTSSPNPFSADSATPGGTAQSFASQYSFGQTPSVFAAPATDNTLPIMVLAGAAILWFMFHITKV